MQLVLLTFERHNPPYQSILKMVYQKTPFLEEPKQIFIFQLDSFKIIFYLCVTRNIKKNMIFKKYVKTCTKQNIDTIDICIQYFNIHLFLWCLIIISIMAPLILWLFYLYLCCFVYGCNLTFFIQSYYQWKSRLCLLIILWWTIPIYDFTIWKMSQNSIYKTNCMYNKIRMFW